MKILFIHTSSPHGTVNAQEGLDAVLMGSAFSACSLLFIGEGVLQLLKGQDLSLLGTKDFARSFGAMRDYGLSRIYCDQQSLNKYGLTNDDLVIDIAPLDVSAIQGLLQEHDKVLSF